MIAKNEIKIGNDLLREILHSKGKKILALNFNKYVELSVVERLKQELKDKLMKKLARDDLNSPMDLIMEIDSVFGVEGEKCQPVSVVVSVATTK